MASNYTRNYNLCQWEASDKVLRTEFNADNAKIDAALAGKASVSSLSSLQSTVSDKASQSALDALTTIVTGHTTSLGKKGNCTLYTTTYTGDGQSNVRKTLTFPSQPWLVVIGGGNGYLILVRGMSYVPAAIGSLYQNVVFWSGNSVSWSHGGSGGASGMMNNNGTSYQVSALLQAD